MTTLFGLNDLNDSVRDSLKLQEVQISEEVSEERPYTILGLSVKEFIIACIILIVSLLVVFFLLKRIIKYIIKRRKAYKNSELYYFNK